MKVFLDESEEGGFSHKDHRPILEDPLNPENLLRELGRKLRERKKIRDFFERQWSLTNKVSNKTNQETKGNSQG